MKFKAGDAVDTDHCIALHHEFLRCHDAFKAFELFATVMIMKGKTRWISYKAYNAYSDFIHHLYEFMVGAYVRDAGDTTLGGKNAREKANAVEGYITRHAQRILSNRRAAILVGTAPAWENGISYFPEHIPDDFATDFREYRNKVHGHVAHERSSELSLSEFYRNYHKFMHMLYLESLNWWGQRGLDFPNLKEITDFSVLISEEIPVQR